MITRQTLLLCAIVLLIVGTLVALYIAPEFFDTAFTYIHKEVPPGTYNDALPESKGAFWLRIHYKLIGDQLKYIFEIGPYTEELYNALSETPSSLMLRFSDSDGFEVLQATELLNGHIRISGGNGTITHFRYEGTVNCSKETYKMIASVSLKWRYDDAFRTALQKATQAARTSKNLQ